jgi:hypothetical protein
LWNGFKGIIRIPGLLGRGRLLPLPLCLRGRLLPLLLLLRQ